jgi:hypothetical protein
MLRWKSYVTIYMQGEDKYSIRLSRLNCRKPKAAHLIDYPYYKIISHS